ncbi:SGNH hydrolase domain-containing protein [Winogradskya consettensis]|uniref:Acyltransferase n=1 Tax=Winogradskya consettensis TaxID=113560 RepID=A0A919SBH9_9ACTN|nr:acyltransferase family protein [Actinoplanes consettensis]GIM67438.1 acyltransferase [Actinoplanes consettensis]
MSISSPSRTTVPAQRGDGRLPGAHLGFRPDIEGLRAVAVVLVVLSHAGVSRLEGGYVGVDVFFVISGFLITTLLVKELGRTGTISLTSFYSRRATRLLPASTLVLVATLIGSWLFLPSTRFASIAKDALFSTFYGINWRLAAEGTDYLNATAAPSPLQHLWSLAVEEQFYFVWPLLLLAIWAWRKGAGVALSVIVVVSLAVSVHQTATAAPWAYFGAHTRAFELAIGALVAVGSATFARTPRIWALILTWSGLVAIVVAAVVFDDHTAFPGYAALLPVLGTAAVIAGGTSGARGGVGLLLGTRPFQEIGKLSYGWYLWHWPVLMIGPAALGRAPSLKLNAALALGALALAFASYHLVENPIRKRRSLLLGLSFSASAAALSLIAMQFTPPLPVGPAAPQTAAELSAASDPQARLTELIKASAKQTKVPSNLTPALNDAGADVPRIYADQCHLNYEPAHQDRPCVYGDPNGAKTVYLIGDSHAAHWFPAFDLAAQQQGWKLVALTKSACQVPSVLVWNVPLKRPYAECVTWRDQVFDRIRADKPALVVMSSNDLDNGGLIDANGNRIPTSGRDDDKLWVDGWQKSFDRLGQPGAQLLLLQDSPWPKGTAPECVAAHADKVTDCNRPRNRSIVEPARRNAVAAAAKARGIRVVNPLNWFCTTTCPAVIGNTLVFKDNSHLTTAYARALAPLIARQVIGAS